MNTAKDVFYLEPENVISDFSDEVPPSAAQEQALAPIATDPRFHQARVHDGVEVLHDDMGLQDSLNNLADLIANVTESYTSAIFLKHPTEDVLLVGGVHTLSRDFNFNAQIAFGSGLIGWTAANSVRISVSPFEHDAQTLQCYNSDQSLKSFVAVPILDREKQTLGVISCDSKKSYAFPKVAEKILIDCAVQTRTLLELHRKLRKEQRERTAQDDKVATLLEELRSFNDEEELLAKVAGLPEEFIERDALVVMVTSHLGVGRGVFYSAGSENRFEHRLLELVCKHKKVLCAERSVHALPRDDSEKRSFLSVPFHVLGTESGSINLLSKPYRAFEAAQIATLEQVANVIGQQLERVRLRDKFETNAEITGTISWKHFSALAEKMLTAAREQRKSLSLIRMSIGNLQEIENLAGIPVALDIMKRIMRLVDQVEGQSGITTYLYGSEILILTDADHAERSVSRLRTLLNNIDLSELSKNSFHSDVTFGELLSQGTRFVITSFPHDGETLGELTAKTLRALAIKNREALKEEVQDVPSWR